MSRKAERRRQAAFDADLGSDDDDLFTQVTGKQKAGSRSRGRTTTFIVRPATNASDPTHSSTSNISRGASPAPHRISDSKEQLGILSEGSTANASMTAPAPPTGAPVITEQPSVMSDLRSLAWAFTGSHQASGELPATLCWLLQSLDPPTGQRQLDLHPSSAACGTRSHLNARHWCTATSRSGIWHAWHQPAAALQRMHAPKEPA